MHIKSHYVILRHSIFYKDIQIYVHNGYFRYIFCIKSLLHSRWYLNSLHDLLNKDHGTYAPSHPPVRHTRTCRDAPAVEDEPRG